MNAAISNAKGSSQSLIPNPQSLSLFLSLFLRRRRAMNDNAEKVKDKQQPKSPGHGGQETEGTDRI